MRINDIEIAGHESIVANLDVVNDEIRPINCKENFSCNKNGAWYQFYFDNLRVNVIMMHRSTLGHNGIDNLFEIGIRDKDTNEWVVDNPYLSKDSNGVEGFKTWNEIQRILKRIFADTMDKECSLFNKHFGEG